MQILAPRILVCDDEIHIVRAVAMKLAKGGFEVEVAHDGQQAWEAIQRQVPQMLISDYQMPRLNGLDLCRRIRQTPELRELPIVLLTAKRLELDFDELSRELWLTRVMGKPFSPRELLQIVESTVGAVAPAKA